MGLGGILKLAGGLPGPLGGIAGMAPGLLGALFPKPDLGKLAGVGLQLAQSGALGPQGMMAAKGFGMLQGFLGKGGNPLDAIGQELIGGVTGELEKLAGKGIAEVERNLQALLGGLGFFKKP